MKSFHQYAGISDFSMKKMVPVPFTCTGLSCARRPRFFPYDFLHRVRYLGLPMRWQYSMSSPVPLLRMAARTSFEYWQRAKVQALVVCWTILKLANIASWVIWRQAVFLILMSAGVAYSLDSTSGGGAVSTYLVSLRFMFRASTRVELHGCAALGMSNAAS